MSSDVKLAIVCSHPIQYFSPWFAWLSQKNDIHLKVFFLDQPLAREGLDIGFARTVKWDVPLLDNFDHSFVENCAADPGSHHYRGLNNPTLWTEVSAFSPAMTLLMCYHYHSILPTMLRGSLPKNTWLRGDSILAPGRKGIGRWLADKVIRRAFSNLAGALYVGEKNRKYFVHHGLQPQQLHYSPPAVSLKGLSSDQKNVGRGGRWRQSLGIPEDHSLVLFVGKLQQIKRPMMLLKAFNAAAVENTSLVFVGSGEEQEALSNAASGDDRIHLLGFQNQSALPDIYAGADLLVLPSITETWGLVVNEAFAYGTGALVSDAVGCAPDLIDGKGTGAIFASDSLEALTDALKGALVDPARLRKWGKAAHQMVERNFSFSNMTAGLNQALGKSDADQRSKSFGAVGGELS